MSIFFHLAGCRYRALSVMHLNIVKIYINKVIFNDIARTKTNRYLFGHMRRVNGSRKSIARATLTKYWYIMALCFQFSGTHICLSIASGRFRFLRHEIDQIMHMKYVSGSKHTRGVCLKTFVDSGAVCDWV